MDIKLHCTESTCKGTATTQGVSFSGFVSLSFPTSNLIQKLLHIFNAEIHSILTSSLLLLMKKQAFLMAMLKWPKTMNQLQKKSFSLSRGNKSSTKAASLLLLIVSVAVLCYQNP